jgi:hypothetical protein
MAVELDREPLVVGTIVVNEELGSHLRMEESAENRILLALN